MSYVYFVQHRWFSVGGGPEFGDKGQVEEEKPDWWAGDGRDREWPKGYTRKKKRSWVRTDPFEVCVVTSLLFKSEFCLTVRVVSTGV